LLQLAMVDIINHCSHEHISTAQLKSCIRIKNFDRLYNSIVVIENYPLQIQFPKNIEYKTYAIREKAEFPIVLGVIPLHNKIIIQYDDKVYSKQDVQTLLCQYIKILHNIADVNNMTINDISNIKPINGIKL